MYKSIIFFCCLSILSAYHTSDVEYFQELKLAENDVFKWLRDEYHFFLNENQESQRMKRENSVESGEDWYKNFQCRADNKSCNIQISEQPKESKIVVEKLQKPKQPERQKEENNEKNMAKQVLLSGHRHYFHHDAAESSNDNADAINRLLHAKTSLASQQNEIHEIELKHQHLTTSATFLENEKFSLNENQLLETQPVINEESSNGNFHSSNFDTSLSSSERGKRSSGQKQKHYDDQFNLKKNTLYDELLELNDSEVGKQHQQWERDSNEPHNRVKRRDVINQINRNDGLSKSIDYDSNGNRLMNYLINPTVEATAMDNNLLNDKLHVNISATITTMQKEMNNGNEKFSNDKSDIKQTTTTAAANNDEIIEKMMSAKNNAKIMRKRDTGELKSHSLHEHLRTIKGRHSISDLISGQLPNQIVKATHNLVNSNELLRQHIKPHLDEPQFSIFKEPNALKSNQMSNLVSYLNELVNDQVKMRSCIELPSELQKFYNELMQHTKTDDNERNKKSVDEFSMTRRKFKRNVQHNNKRQHHSKLELEQKCKRVYFFHAECLKIDKCTSMKPSLIEYFKGHEEICEILKKKNFEKKSKRSFKELNDVTAEFAKLYNYKNYFLESNFE